MKSKLTLIFFALAALNLAACGKGKEPAKELAKVSVSATTSLQITPSPQTPHTVGKFDLTTSTIVAKNGEVGALMFGPYAKLQPGKYEVTYFVTAESDVYGTEVGTLDVEGYIPPSVDDKLAQAPLKSAHEEQVIKLTFESKNPSYEFQFRVWTNGKGNRVSIRNIHVQKLN